MRKPIQTNEIDHELMDLLLHEIQWLRDKLDGELLVAGDAAYECAYARGELLLESYPSFVVRAATMDDICVARAFAARHGLNVVLRRAGWIIGDANCTDGVLIDVAE